MILQLLFKLHRSFSWQYNWLLILLSPGLCFAANENFSKWTILFDIDDVLVRREHSVSQMPNQGRKIIKFEYLQQVFSYEIRDSIDAVFCHLSKKSINIGIFSDNSLDFISELLKHIPIHCDGLLGANLENLINKNLIFGRDDSSRKSANNVSKLKIGPLNFQHGGPTVKNINAAYRKHGVDFDAEHTILVDNSLGNTSSGEERNFLWLKQWETPFALVLGLLKEVTTPDGDLHNKLLDLQFDLPNAYRLTGDDIAKLVLQGKGWIEEDAMRANSSNSAGSTKMLGIRSELDENSSLYLEVEDIFLGSLAGSNRVIPLDLSDKLKAFFTTTAGSPEVLEILWHMAEKIQKDPKLARVTTTLNLEILFTALCYAEGITPVESADNGFIHIKRFTEERNRTKGNLYTPSSLAVDLALKMVKEPSGFESIPKRVQFLSFARYLLKQHKREGRLILDAYEEERKQLARLASEEPGDDSHLHLDCGSLFLAPISEGAARDLSQWLNQLPSLD